LGLPIIQSNSLCYLKQITESVGFKDDLDTHYTDEEAEALARAELGLQKTKTSTTIDAMAIPDLYSKKQDEIKKLASLGIQKKTGFPELYGKTREQIAEEIKKL
jgi:hypothetical protein